MNSQGNKIPFRSHLAVGAVLSPDVRDHGGAVRPSEGSSCACALVHLHPLHCSSSGTGTARHSRPGWTRPDAALPPNLTRQKPDQQASRQNTRSNLTEWTAFPCLSHFVEFINETVSARYTNLMNNCEIALQLVYRIAHKLSINSSGWFRRRKR